MARGIPWLGLLGCCGGASPPIFFFSNSSWYLIWNWQSKAAKVKYTGGRVHAPACNSYTFSPLSRKQSLCAVHFLSARGLPLALQHPHVCGNRWGMLRAAKPQEAAWHWGEMTSRQPEVVWAQSCIATLTDMLGSTGEVEREKWLEAWGENDWRGNMREEGEEEVMWLSRALNNLTLWSVSGTKEFLINLSSQCNKGNIQWYNMKPHWWLRTWLLSDCTN